MNTNTYGEEIHLNTIDSATIYNTLITELEKYAKEPLYPGDERRIYGEALAAVFVALYNTMDDTGRQTLLKHARGEVLDAIGERMDVTRLSGDYAKCIMRFCVSAPRSTNIIIPKWTKVTPDGVHYFATDEIAVLQAGAYNVEVPVSATVKGEAYNGYAKNTISTLVDLVPYIESVYNVTETAEGDDGEPYTTEGDDRFRERIRLAPAKRSTAGPELAYIYWAMTADGSIVDVKAYSEKETITRTLTVYAGHAFVGGDTLLSETLVVRANAEALPAVLGEDYTVEYLDGLLTITLTGALNASNSIVIEIDRTMEGRVKIVPLLEGGEIPDAALLEKVLEVCNDKSIRPMTDLVTAEAPEVVYYDIDFVYYTTPADESTVVQNVEGADGAIQRFIEYQREALGRDINPDKLRELVLYPSWTENPTRAIRIDITQPQHTALSDTQVARFSGNLKVSHKTVTGVV